MPKGVRNGQIRRGRPGAFPPLKPMLRSFCTSFSIFSKRVEPSLCLFYRLCIFPNFELMDDDVFFPWHLCIAECKHITELLERLGILHHFWRSKVGIDEYRAWFIVRAKKKWICLTSSSVGGALRNRGLLSDAARVKAWSFSSSYSPDSSLSELY